MKPYFAALLLIVVSGILPIILHRRFKAMKLVGFVTLAAGCCLGLVYACVHLSSSRPAELSEGWQLLHVFSLSFRMDGLSAFFLLPIFTIAPLAALYSYSYLEKPAHALRVAANFFFFALLTASMALVACADSILSFALAWEFMSLSSFFLVIYDFEKKSVRQAGYLYFVFAQTGALFLFGAFALAYRYTGSLDLTAFAAVPATAKALIFTLAFIGFGSKAGIMPLHVWLPHAHPAAPSHISAIMSGVMIKMGIYGIIRMYALLLPAGPFCARMVILAGAVTGVFGVVYALGQHDLKRLLAYHSVENIGIILLGIGIGMLGMNTNHPAMAVLGFAGGLLHVLNHAIFKSLLFMGAGAVRHRTGTLIIERLGGLLKRLPLCSTAFLIGSLAICGLPPFNGFVSEFMIYKSAFLGAGTDGALFLFFVLAILSLAIIGGLAIACFTKVIGVVFLGEPRSRAAAEAQPAGTAIQVAMIILAAACLLIGLAPQGAISLAVRAAASVVSAPSSFSAAGLANNLSLGATAFAAMVLVFFGLRHLLQHGPAAWSATWGCGFTQPDSRMQYTGSSFAASFLDFYRPFVLVKEKFSGIHGLFPAAASYHSETCDVSESGLQYGLVNPVLYLAGRLRWLQHGHIQLYIGYIFFAMLGLLGWLVL